MGHPIARRGDPLDHGGQVSQGSGTWNCEGLPIARVGDQAQCSRHGTVTITQAGSSSIHKVDGQYMARVGSVCSCGALITSGSSKWQVA